MPRLSITGPDFEYDPEDPDGFRSGVARLGPSLGAKETGISVYELRRGQAICPYHYEHAEEEWLLVLSGRPSLRTPAGEEELAPGDIAFFPKGPEGAHGVRNTTEETARVLMFSTVRYPAVSVYPDSDKIGVYVQDGEDNVVVPRSAGVPYFTGEG